MKLNQSSLWWFFAAISVLFLGLMAWQSIHAFVSNVELESLSFRQRLFSLPPKDRSQVTPISIVALDLKTSLSPDMLRLFGRPMSRSAPAYVVRFLNRAKAKAILFDIAFNGGQHTHDPEGDLDLVNSIRGYSNIDSVLHMERKWTNRDDFATYSASTQKAILKNSVKVSGIDKFPLYGYNYRFQSLILSYPELLEQSGMHFYSSSTSATSAILGRGDEDTTGDSRRWVPFSLYAGHVFPTLALGVVLDGQKDLTLTPDGHLSWHGGHVDLGADGIPLVKWYGHGVRMDKPVYPEFSFWDVLVSEMVLECQENPHTKFCGESWLPKVPPLKPSQFTNQYVVIGETLRRSDDVHSTIYGLRYSGVYVVVNALDNVLHNDFVHPAPLWMNLILFLTLPIILWLLALRHRSVLNSFLLTVTLALGAFVLGIIAYNNWNLWLNTTYPILGVMTFFTVIYLYRYWQEQKLRQQLRYAFGKYVSPAVMQWIEKHPERLVLGGERREMTFLFCDIQGFTAYADSHPPEEVQAVLSSYFSAMNHIILHDYQGSINKLMGDAIMAYWGFPLQTEQDALQAVSAALEMLKTLEIWRKIPGNPPLDIRIGIHTGEAVVGNVGSEEFMDFTVIGDAVNIAARLETTNKELGTHILISSETYKQIEGKIQAKCHGEILLRGRELPVTVYEPYAGVESH